MLRDLRPGQIMRVRCKDGMWMFMREPPCPAHFSNGFEMGAHVWADWQHRPVRAYWISYN